MLRRQALHWSCPPGRLLLRCLHGHQVCPLLSRHHSRAVGDAECTEITKEAQKIVSEKQPFQRLVCTKEDALNIFEDNPFKVSIISSKVPDGSLTTIYKCGSLVDLCMGPHLPNTGRVKGFAVTKNSACYWLGSADNDTLQRIYGISFPNTKLLKEWKQFQEEARKNDHRRLGEQQELFFFHELSPGSCFFEPLGAHVYNKLVEFIRKQYHKRGYTVWVLSASRSVGSHHPQRLQL